MNLFEFSDLFTVAIGLNFAFIIIDGRNANSSFHSLLELRLAQSIERVTKRSLEKLTIPIFFENKLKFADKQEVAAALINSVSQIKNEINTITTQSIQKAQKTISVSHLSHTSLLFGFYALLLLYISPRKFSAIEDHLLITNIICFTIFIFIILCEAFHKIWRYRVTLWAITILYLTFVMCQVFQVTINASIKVISFNFYIIASLPFLGFGYYFLKALIGTEIVFLIHRFKLWRCHIRRRIKIFQQIIDDNEVIQTIDGLKSTLDK